MVAVTEDRLLESLAEEVRKQAREGCEKLDMETLLSLAPWSRRQMERRFRDKFLTSPARYFRDCQTEIAGKLLRDGEDVLSASMKSGFASPGRLHDAIVTRYGLTPGEVRRKAAGVHIDFGFFKTQIGTVMLAATSRGLCALHICGWDASSERLAEEVEELTEDYPQAEIDENAELLQPYADQLVAYLDKQSPAFCPTVDILRGTTFQREVWAELQKLEPGDVLSYSELAARIGRRQAVRAVANACARNNLAIAIPCHRIIHSNGSMSGYRWGVEWKRRLLEIEKQIEALKVAEAVTS